MGVIEGGGITYKHCVPLGHLPRKGSEIYVIYVPPIAYCLLPTAYCLLPTVSKDSPTFDPHGFTAS